LQSAALINKHRLGPAGNVSDFNANMVFRKYWAALKRF